MPNAQTVQRGLFGGVMPNSSSTPACAGGCGHELTPESSDWALTPEGVMCSRCIADLYTKCADCGKLLRFDDWGECDDLRVGPDDRERCCSCDANTFSTCTRCNRRTVREGGDVRTNPDRSSEEFCRRCWDSFWFVCQTCDDVFSRQVAFLSPDGNHNHCEECFEQSYFLCSGCRTSFVRDSMRGWAGDPFCENCFGNADVWKSQPWEGVATGFDRVGSERCYGVELETERCEGYRELQRHTKWGCVYECSTPGREFVSPILQGDAGFDEIRKMCSIADDLDWTVNRACGLHVHIDARDLTSDQMLQVVYAYRRSYPLWKRFVDRRRGENSMCGSPQYSPQDVRDAEHIEDFAESRDRFEFVNWRAYLRHGSIEIRLYHGSLKAREVCNWVALHARFVDAVKDLTFDEIDVRIGGITRSNWRGLVELVGDPKLLDYWRRAANKIGQSLPALWLGDEELVTVDEPDEVDEVDDDSDGPPRIGDGTSRHCGSDTCIMCNENYGRLDSVNYDDACDEGSE